MRDGERGMENGNRNMSAFDGGAIHEERQEPVADRRSPFAARSLSRRDALRITAAAGLALAFGGKLGGALFDAAGVRRRSATRVRMATPVTVTVFHHDPAAADALVEATFAEMERLEAILTRHRPDAPVARLAQDGVLRGAPEELVEVLGRALEISSATDGAFDITVAPVLDLYRRRVAAGEMLPTADEVEELLALVDYRALRLDGRDIALARPGMSITLDGIAKGYVVDRAVATLVRGGAERVLVNAGGDLSAAGGGASEWEVAVQDPRNAAASLDVLHVRAGGVASSGDYLQAFTLDRSIHHILDPRTGSSPVRTSAATVTAPSAMDADALATAAFVLGPTAGIALLDQLAGVEGLIVDKDGTRYPSGGFGAHI